MIISGISMKPLHFEWIPFRLFWIFWKEHRNFSYLDLLYFNFYVFCFFSNTSWKMNSESNQIFWTQWNHGIAITRMTSFGIWVFGSRIFRTWLNSHRVVLAILVGYLNSKFHQIVNSVKQLQCNKSLFKWLRIFWKKNGNFWYLVL